MLGECAPISAAGAEAGRRTIRARGSRVRSRRMRTRTRRAEVSCGTLLVFLARLLPGAAAAAPAPGAPGEPAVWTEADKDGFGTAHSRRSKVWHTLDDGELTEVFYPDIDTPAL